MTGVVAGISAGAVFAIALSDRGSVEATGPAPAAAASPAATAAAAPVTRKRAERIAVRHIERRFGQRARVDSSERENDRGARWEIGVIRRDRVEFDVYVSAAGRVVHVQRKGRDRDAGGDRRSERGSIGQREAERLAERHVEQRFGMDARVTDSDPTRGEGARWWVELRRSDGAIVEVYVTSSGRIAQVEVESGD